MEKIVKSVNSLKYSYGELAVEEKISKDAGVSAKDRQIHCKVVTDTLVSNILKGHSDFTSLLAISIEILLQACSDESADVRLNAEECLNRLIKGLHENSISKILVELFKEIKKNGSPRSLKAALIRFADLCFIIRPSKCRPYILSLLPCLVHVSQRNEEVIQEALSPSITKIFSNLGAFANEGEIQGLIASFLKNLSHDSVMVRRTAGICLHSIVASSRKLASTLLTSIESVIDILNQRWDDRNTMLGCLQSLRLLSPLLNERSSGHIKTNFIITKILVSSLCYLCNSDHTVITSALELLEQLLKSFTVSLKQILISELQLKGFISGNAVKNTAKAAADSKVDGEVSAEEQSILGWRDIQTVTIDPMNPNGFPITKLARMLCQRFIFSHQAKELLPDSQVRVSTKTLALNCLNVIISMEPILFLAPVFSSQESGSLISDVSLLLNHSDPKIRGAVLVLLANYLRSLLLLSNGNIAKWYGIKKAKYSHFPLPGCPGVDDVVKKLLHSFTDDTSTCLRQSCAAVSISVDVLLRSEHFESGLSLLHAALMLSENSYWLLKNDLLDLLSSLNYRHIAFVEGCRRNQDKYSLQTFQKMSLSVIFGFLSDEDGRVRRAAVDTLLSALESFTPCDNLDRDFLSLEAQRLCLEQLSDELLGNGNDVSTPAGEHDVIADKNLLKTFRGFETRPVSDQVSDSLSLVVGDVTTLLAQSSSTSQTRGCLLALNLLSLKYPPGCYPSSWGCHFVELETPSARVHSGITVSDTSNASENVPKTPKEFIQLMGPLPTVMALLQSSWLPLDISTHCDALTLAGNLIAGAAAHCFSFRKRDSKKTSQTDSAKSLSNASIRSDWHGVSEPTLSQHIRELFVYLVRLVSMSHHVISDIPSGSLNKSVLPNIASSPSVSSPMKKKKEAGNDVSRNSPPLARKRLSSTPLSKTGVTKEDNEKEKTSKKTIGIYHHNRVLMKLHDLLVGAYKNYKGSLEFGKGDRFCSFVSVVLEVLCQLLEIADFLDIASSTDELLGYLKTTFRINPPLTIQCVHQLLKALFGTNLLSQLELNQALNIISSSPLQGSFDTRGFKSTLSHQVFHLPLNNLTMSLANSVHLSHSGELNKDTGGWFGSIKKKVEEKLQKSGKTSKGNKMTIQNYIRLFEPLVIKSLKLYTVTSSVELQKHTLNMLAQLVQLRVNYNMLDSDQIFINFVIKQFESIEGGMIRESDNLIPHVFFFLVLLTYEMYHSKGVIGMSKVIQLCDGLMASERDAISHVIPALEPIVHDLFVVRATLKSGEISTQREVVLAMLIKNVRFPQIIPMLTAMLRFYRKDDVERWKSVSRLLADLILPLLKVHQIGLTSYQELTNLRTLFELFPPASMPPLDDLLAVLLTNRPKASPHLWLAKLLLLLRFFVCHVTEGDLAIALEHEGVVTLLNRMNLGEDGVASEGGHTGAVGLQRLARFLHHSVSGLCSEMRSSLCDPILNSSKEELLFFVQEFIELLLLLTYIHRSGTYKGLTAASRGLDHASSLTLANFLIVGQVHPLLTLIWAQYLIQLSSVSLKTWSSLTGGQLKGATVTFNKHIIKVGAVILLCDYTLCLTPENVTRSKRAPLVIAPAACQNANQSDLVTWLLDNHTRDVIALSGEAPVEDFLSMIDRPPMSKAFVRQISLLCDGASDVETNFMRRIVDCVSSLSESYDALQLLLSRRFLFSPVIALSRSCDRLACVIVESLLARDARESGELITTEEVTQLMETFPSRQSKRFSRLKTLLARLKSHLTGSATSFATSIDKIISDTSMHQPPDKTWLKFILISACDDCNWSPECAKVLSCFEYDDVMEIMGSDKFRCQHLDVCVAYGASECAAHSPSIHDDNLSSIMKASRDSMTSLLDEIVRRTEENTPDDRDVIGELCDDVTARDEVMSLCSCFARYFHANAQLPTNYQIDKSIYPRCLKLARIACQVLHRLHSQGPMPRTSVSLSCFEMLQQMWKIDEICTILTGAEADGIFFIIQAIHSTTQSYVGTLPSRHPYFPSSCVYDESNRAMASCLMTSQLFDLFYHQVSQDLPEQLCKSLYNLVLHICRCKCINSYIRVPRILWKYGWDPPVKNGCIYPDIPSEYLQEKEILSEFVGVTGRLGWISRTQFEETWASLLGVLVSQPLNDVSREIQSNEDTIAISCLAVRGLTSLVISSSLQPHGGAPVTGYYVAHHRHPPLKFAHSKWGKRLIEVRSILQEELRAVQKPLHHCEAHFRYQRKSPGDGTIHDLLSQNVEQVTKSSSNYALGQVSAHSFFELYGISPIQDESVSIDASLEASSDGSEPSDVFDADGKSPTIPKQSEELLSPNGNRDGVDTHSCVQFLLDLYSGWFRSSDSSGTGPLALARPLLCECVRSLLLVSDLFTQRHQFEWLINTLSVFCGSQASEDDVILQYVVTSFCKAAAVLGMTTNVCDLILLLLEASLGSSLVSCRTSAVYGALYCLECYPNKNMSSLVRFLLDLIPKECVAVAGRPSLHNEDYVLALISLSFFTIERCQDAVTPEFVSVILQAASLILSAIDVTTRVYHSVAQGLERLVLLFALSASQCEAVLKVAAEQLQVNSSLPRATAACALMITCMYCGRMRATIFGNTVQPQDDASEYHDDEIEMNLVAMERISILFERIRKGRSLDSRILIRILPQILQDYFPPATILNKVIAEFASSFQPFPNLVALLLHKVFQNLHNTDQSALVNEWVILSLSNMIQKTPLSSAVWCLTCFFVSASTNHWMNSLLPLVTSRMMKSDPCKDYTLFCKAAIDFYSCQLSEELDRRSFQSVFIASSHEEPYKILIHHLEEFMERKNSAL